MTDHNDAIERALERMYPGKIPLHVGMKGGERDILRDLVAEVTEQAAIEAGSLACQAHRDRLARIVELVKNRPQGEDLTEFQRGYSAGLADILAIAREGGEQAADRDDDLTAKGDQSPPLPAAPDLRCECGAPASAHYIPEQGAPWCKGFRIEGSDNG